MKLHTAIRAVLRRLWLYSEPRRDCLREAKLPGRGNGWQCAMCGEATKKPQVDHRVCVGSTPGSKNGQDATWDGFIERLFCDTNGLRVLCKNCHDKVTFLQRQRPSKKTASN